MINLKLLLKAFICTVCTIIIIIALLSTFTGDPVFVTVFTFGTSIIFIIFLCTFFIIDEK